MLMGLFLRMVGVMVRMVIRGLDRLVLVLLMLMMVLVLMLMLLRVLWMWVMMLMMLLVLVLVVLLLVDLGKQAREEIGSIGHRSIYILFVFFHQIKTRTNRGTVTNEKWSVGSGGSLLRRQTEKNDKMVVFVFLHFTVPHPTGGTGGLYSSGFSFDHFDRNRERYRISDRILSFHLKKWINRLRTVPLGGTSFEDMASISAVLPTRWNPRQGNQVRVSRMSKIVRSNFQNKERERERER
jgi:Ca2+/Na+ antiporter